MWAKKKRTFPQMTVSRVFNHPETVSDEAKRARLFSAVKRTQLPSASAKALKNKKDSKSSKS